MPSRTLQRSSILLGGLVAVLVACGGDAAQSGETLIETELADQIGLGELEASCDQPENSEIGTEFRCSATTTDDRVVEFVGVFTSETEIFVSPTNLLNRDEITTVAEQSAALLGPELGVEVDPAQITCPTDEVVFLGGPVDEGVLECTITDPGDGTEFELVVTLTEYVPQQGYQNLFVEFGDPVS